MDKKYLQRRSHRFTQGRIPINLIYIKNVAVKDNKMPVGIKLYFLAIQHVILMKKSCFEFTNTAKHFFIIKPTRCTNFPNVSGSSSVHHQEFIHWTLCNGVCHTAFEQD